MDFDALAPAMLVLEEQRQPVLIVRQLDFRAAGRVILKLSTSLKAGILSLKLPCTGRSKLEAVMKGSTQPKISGLLLVTARRFGFGQRHSPESSGDGAHETHPETALHGTTGWSSCLHPHSASKPWLPSGARAKSTTARPRGSPATYPEAREPAELQVQGIASDRKPSAFNSWPWLTAVNEVSTCAMSAAPGKAVWGCAMWLSAREHRASRQGRGALAGRWRLTPCGRPLQTTGAA